MRISGRSIAAVETTLVRPGTFSRTAFSIATAALSTAAPSAPETIIENSRWPPSLPK